MAEQAKRMAQDMLAFVQQQTASRRAQVRPPVRKLVRSGELFVPVPLFLCRRRRVASGGNAEIRSCLLHWCGAFLPRRALLHTTRRLWE